MNSAQAAPGRYEHDPMPFIGLAAVAAGVCLSAPALLLGIVLAPLARRARVAFAALALLGAGFVALAWGAISLAMHRAERAGQRAGMFMHTHDALSAAWPHIRTWWLLASPLCFAVASAITLFRRRSVRSFASVTSVARTESAGALNARREGSSASVSDRAASRRSRLAGTCRGIRS